MIYYYFKNKKNVYKLKKILNYIKNELKINYIDIINLNNFIKNNKILGDNFFIFLIDDLDEKFFDYLNKINESIIGIFFI
ncbi:MAG: hypothetical protein ACPL1F_06605, partial [bacterium]